MENVRITLVHPHGMAADPSALLPNPVPVINHDWGIELTWYGTLIDPEATRIKLCRQAKAIGWDVAVLTGRLVKHPPKLIVLDVDSTLITSEVIDLLAAASGQNTQVTALTERAMRGEIDFGESLRQRVAALKGLPAQILAEIIPQLQLSPGATNLIQAVKATGGQIGVVSGGFIEVVQPLANNAGIDFAVANQLEVVAGILTGRTIGEIIDQTAKLRYTQDFAAQLDLSLTEVIAVGDGANDLAMLKAVGLGVGYCAKPLVASQASATISFPRLDAVRAFAGI